MRALNVGIEVVAGEYDSPYKQHRNGHGGMRTPLQIWAYWARNERASGNVDHAATLIRCLNQEIFDR